MNSRPNEAKGNERTTNPEPPPDAERDRRLGNAVILAAFLVVVGIGIWLANAMIDYRRIDDCLARGGRNCAPIETPPRR